MGSVGITQEFIISYNSDGQELRIPRSTYEQRLKMLRDTKQSIMDMGNINPDELRRIDNQIRQLEESLRTGRTNR